MVFLWQVEVRKVLAKEEFMIDGKKKADMTKSWAWTSAKLAGRFEDSRLRRVQVLDGGGFCWFCRISCRL